MSDLLAVLSNPTTRPEGADGIAALLTKEVPVNELSMASLVAPVTKTCHVCKEAKPVEAFGIYRRSTDGRRASCKACVKAGRTKRTKKAVAPAPLRRHWSVAERDDDVFVVRSTGADDVLVHWEAADGWICGACGPQTQDGAAQEVCEHASAATQALSVGLAARLAARLAPPTRNASVSGGTTVIERSTNQDPKPTSARAAERRASRQAELERDVADRRKITSAIAVRQMTDEDRQKLAARRAARRRRFGPPEPDERPSRRRPM